MKHIRKGTRCRMAVLWIVMGLLLTACTNMTEPADESGSFSTEAETLDGERFQQMTYTGEVHEGTGIYYQGSLPYVVLVDAGHQGAANHDREPIGPGSDQTKDKVAAGATGSFTHVPESKLNLAVALAVRDELIRRGYTVVMVRETQEVDISNRERALLANDCGADAYIRIHANGHSDPSVRGALTMCQSPSNPYPDCAAAYEPSRRLSETVLDSFCKTTGMPERSMLESDTMTGLNWASVPSTILEMGFMSNQTDDTLMNSTAFYHAAAQGVADGIDGFFGR